ncbi:MULTISPECIES: hypothetical protein [Pseudomonas]|uniref:Uncharacterized protein n=1 Tax=Pseudomonas putida (strain ATCC 47054 / DSM 6125 / CFBP 8728 / NCIMB 11950 / KT2440) TaxID=160488 RepID=Q88G40_PSEPK|nr:MULTISPECIES: hypothetical protein [Pseudomonas]AAN69480.1 conserved protein of unknown function [Pseudomonas putida KT2440]MDD2082027.1 hypothetical protein [Pseudomonas putida]QDW57284.1 hypothetical protein FFH79_010570 [Pseudomonas sp. KBS0802]QXZ06520.1 hypothetical protein HG554_20285 [Pseudomonas putida]UUX22894.1 hypothetical protein M8Z99_20355 [Pseudomonas putida]
MKKPLDELASVLALFRHRDNFAFGEQIEKSPATQLGFVVFGDDQSPAATCRGNSQRGDWREAPRQRPDRVAISTHSKPRHMPGLFR